VGAVIADDDNTVLATGYNGFPRGVDTDEEDRWERPAKYDWVEHAERNAIYNAARKGIKLLGSTMYLPFKAYPCAPCMRAIIQAGIKRLVCSDIPFPGKGNKTAYDTDSDIQMRMCEEAGVEVYTVTEED
jgi:dCMP deaminase